jgi:hypothetical protein
VVSATNRAGTFPQEPCPAAELYLRQRLAPIPVAPRSKDPGYPDWQHLRLTLDSLATHFPAGEERNVGVLNGEPSGNVLDVDLDCPEALRAAPLLLPPTGWVFGRLSAPRSHFIYQADAPLDAAQQEYRDLDGTMPVELRGTGGLTVYPPSVHPGGERIVWDQFTEPGSVALADLERAVGEVATAALLARHMPRKGTRQDVYLALSGGLSRAGWGVDRIERFLEVLATVAGDEECRKRVQTAGRTDAKVQAGEKATGWPKFIDLFGGRGEPLARRVRDWLGLSGAPAESPIPGPPPWPAPPSEEAFHGLAGKIVRAIEPASEADPAALLVQVLLAFGNAVGRSAHFCVEADRHHANEFAALVGKSSKARKGTS